jgi:uncharacterized protein involved in cysteine biosynthesis
MDIVPCPLCGYHAPGASCPHCGGLPPEKSLRAPLGGPFTGLWDGLCALPRGLLYLARTRGVKRWLLPPLLLTAVVFVTVMWWAFTGLGALVDSVVPGDLELEGSWAWLENLPDTWNWLKATWAWLVQAGEWVANAALALLASQPLKLLGWFLIGSLAAWYCFSIAYEALAGPFLDEIQARLEARWFGADPRSRLERPTDIPAERCVRLSTLSAGVALVLIVALAQVPLFGWWGALLFAPLSVLPAWLLDRRFGTWLAWVAKVEGRALWASLQASIVTAFLLVFSLPLYFIPGVGYFLFAGVCGFATAVGLLDIPFERRGWTLRQRMRFLGRNLPPLIAFGVVAGALLSVPIVGPILMVPSASVGGLWLICRLDNSFLRPADAPECGTLQTCSDTHEGEGP